MRGPHLSGAELPVPGIRGVEVVAWQAQGAHVHGVSQLQKDRPGEERDFLLRFRGPSTPSILSPPRRPFKNPNYPDDLIEGSRSHRPGR